MKFKNLTDEIAFYTTIHLSRNYQVVIDNFYYNGFESDILVFNWDRMYSFEYEIKVTKADFNKDKAKCKRDWYSYSRNIIKTKEEMLLKGELHNKFYYVAPKGLISKEELPDYAGLLEIDMDYTKARGYSRIDLVKHAKFLTKEKKELDFVIQLLYKLDNRCSNLKRRIINHNRKLKKGYGSNTIKNTG